MMKSVVRKAANFLLALAIGVLISGTIAGELTSDEWWIRLWDFPRTAIAAIGAVLAIIAWFFAPGTWRHMGFIAALAVCLWQLWRIFPYTPLADQEVAIVEDGAAEMGDRCFTALALNVYQENREYQRSIDLITDYSPDLLLLTETDDRWAEALRDVTSHYPHQLLKPQGNTYGMMFLSRLPFASAKLRYLIEPDIPSVDVKLSTKAGQSFRMLGLHPRPPKPGNDVTPRDAEIVVAARDARQAGLPVLALGDFNDVAWSTTSRMFKRLGEFNDPREGRGLYATFPAKLPAFRWPLDHIFLTEEFVVTRLEVLKDVGSDHLPIFTELCLSEQAGQAVNEQPDKATDEDHEDAADTMKALNEKD